MRLEISEKRVQFKFISKLLAKIFVSFIIVSKTQSLNMIHVSLMSRVSV